MAEQTKRGSMAVVLAYDSDCGICTRFRNMVAFLDAKHKLEFTDLKDADSLGLLEGVPPAKRYASFHVVDTQGEGKSGAEALPTLSLHLPGGGISGAIFSSPLPFKTIRFAYNALSRMHGTGACSPKTAGGP